MGGLEFVTSLAGALAWPVAVVTCAVIFRQQVGGLLHRLTALEAPGGIKATFGSLSKVEETVAAVAIKAQPVTATDLLDEPRIRWVRETDWALLQARADSSPKDAVLDAWGLLEYQLNLVSDRIDPTCAHGWPNVKESFKTLDQWPALQPALSELRHLRDVTAHSVREPSRVDALRYVSVARDLVTTLDMIVSVLPARPTPPDGSENASTSDALLASRRLSRD